MIKHAMRSSMNSATLLVWVGAFALFGLFGPVAGSSGASWPTPTLSPSDPRAMWAEGTGANNDGATRDFYNRAAELRWDNYMGDWRDSAGIAQGSSAYAISTLFDDNTPGFESWDVTSLVDEWRAGAPNQGLYLRQVSGSGPFDFYSREYSVPEERPSLNVVTDMGNFVLPSIADTGLRSSSFGSPGDAPTLRIKGNSNSILSRFDLSAIPEGASVTNATLRLFNYADFGGSSMDVGVFRVFNDPGGVAPVVNGLAQGYQGDVGIGAHPDVYVYTDFENANWGLNYKGATNASTLERVNSSPGFEPIGNSALRVTIPAGENYGMNVQYGFLEQIGTEPTEVFFRYYARFDDNWNPGEAGKLPGMAGRYDSAGWGGRQSDGTNGWSARGTFRPTIPAGNPLEDRVPIGNYVYHADQPSQFGQGFVWQDGLLGYLEKNRWYSVEQRLVLNTPGSNGGQGLNDGILETWIDGRLAYRQTDWRWRDVDNLKIEEVWLNVYYGGTGTPDTDIQMYIDNLVIASSYIGPMTGAPGDPGAHTGDFDNDNDVDGADFLKWQQGFDGIYNATQLTDWLDQYGSGVGGISAGNVVPEPNSYLLMMLGCLLVLPRTRAAEV